MSSITISNFFEKAIANKQAIKELVEHKGYQLAVRNHCLQICKNRNIRVNKLYLTKTKCVYLFPIEIIKEVVSKEAEAKQTGKPRGRNVKPKLKKK